MNTGGSQVVTFCSAASGICGMNSLWAFSGRVAYGNRSHDAGCGFDQK